MSKTNVHCAEDILTYTKKKRCLKKRQEFYCSKMCLICPALTIIEVFVLRHLNYHIHMCISSTEPFLRDIGKLRYEQNNLWFMC